MVGTIQNISAGYNFAIGTKIFLDTKNFIISFWTVHLSAGSYGPYKVYEGNIVDQASAENNEKGNA